MMKLMQQDSEFSKNVLVWLTDDEAPNLEHAKVIGVGLSPASAWMHAAEQLRAQLAIAEAEAERLSKTLGGTGFQV